MLIHLNANNLFVPESHFIKVLQAIVFYLICVSDGGQFGSGEGTFSQCPLGDKVRDNVTAMFANVQI